MFCVRGDTEHALGLDTVAHSHRLTAAGVSAGCPPRTLSLAAGGTRHPVDWLSTSVQHRPAPGGGDQPARQSLAGRLQCARCSEPVDPILSILMSSRSITGACACDQRRAVRWCFGLRCRCRRSLVEWVRAHLRPLGRSSSLTLEDGVE